MDSPTLISLNEAAALTSLSRTMLNRYRAEGQFPDAVPMGDRRVAFVRGEVLAWIQDRIDRRNERRAANDNVAASGKEAA
ncbi:MAG: AlpA family phage regulatory protein [Xanthobacteraceae bacterium]